jgi:hypothetical protein
VRSSSFVSPFTPQLLTRCPRPSISPIYRTLIASVTRCALRRSIYTCSLAAPASVSPIPQDAGGFGHNVRSPSSRLHLLTRCSRLYLPEFAGWSHGALAIVPSTAAHSLSCLLYVIFRALIASIARCACLSSSLRAFLSSSLPKLLTRHTGLLSPSFFAERRSQGGLSLFVTSAAAHSFCPAVSLAHSQVVEHVHVKVRSSVPRPSHNC